jgi:hypothetical protein
MGIISYKSLNESNVGVTARRIYLIVYISQVKIKKKRKINLRVVQELETSSGSISANDNPSSVHPLVLAEKSFSCP